MKKLFYPLLLLVGLSFAGCKSYTTIFSNPGNAEVYINGEYKGTTPYEHSDRRIIGTAFDVTLKKQGFEDYSTNIRRLEKPALPLAASVFLTVPPTGLALGIPGVLWSTKYKRSRIFSLDNTTADNRFELPVSVSFSPELTKVGLDLNSYLFASGEGLKLYANQNLYTLDANDNVVKTMSLSGITTNEYIVDVFESNSGTVIVTSDLLEWRRMANAISLEKYGSKNLLNDTYKISVDVIDEDGDKNLSRDLIEGTNISFISSPGKKFFGVRGNDVLKVFDHSFKLLGEYKITENHFGFVLTDEGITHGLEIADNKVSINQFFQGELKTTRLTVPNGYDVEQFVINVNPDTKAVVVSSVLGEQEQKKERKIEIRLNGMKQRGELFKAQGSHLSFLSMETLKEEKTSIIPFSEEIINSQNFSEVKDGGIIYLNNRGVLFSGEEVIQQLEQSWVVFETKNTIVQGARTYYSSLVLLKPVGQENIQRVIKKSGSAAAGYEDLGSFRTYVRNGNIFLFYNNETQRQRKYDFVMSVLDTDLNNLYTELFPFEKSKVAVAVNGNVANTVNNRSFLAYSKKRTKIFRVESL